MDAKTSKIKDIAEILHQPRSKTLSFYLVLLIAVLPIWSIVPAAWAFVVYSLHSGLVWTFAWRGKLLFAVALCEVSPESYDFITNTCCDHSQLLFQTIL